MTTTCGPIVHQTAALFLTVGTDREGAVAEVQYCTEWTDAGQAVDTTGAMEDHQAALDAGCEGGAVTYRLTPPADMDPTRYRYFAALADAVMGLQGEALAAHLATLCEVTVLEETVMAPGPPNWDYA